MLWWYGNLYACAQLEIGLLSSKSVQIRNKTSGIQTYVSFLACSLVAPCCHTVIALKRVVTAWQVARHFNSTLHVEFALNWLNYRLVMALLHLQPKRLAIMTAPSCDVTLSYRLIWWTPHSRNANSINFTSNLLKIVWHDIPVCRPRDNENERTYSGSRLSDPPFGPEIEPRRFFRFLVGSLVTRIWTAKHRLPVCWIVAVETYKTRYHSLL